MKLKVGSRLLKSVLRLKTRELLDRKGNGDEVGGRAESEGNGVTWLDGRGEVDNLGEIGVGNGG